MTQPRLPIAFPGARYVPPGPIDVYYYANSRTALVVDDGETGVTLTLNLPDERLDDGEYPIKTYSGNEGVIEALVEAGIALPPHRFLTSGYVAIPVVRLTPAVREVLDAAP